MAIRVLIADDHGVLRAGLRTLLNAESDMVVVGEAQDGLRVVSMAENLDPDVILMDINMPLQDGLEGMRQILEKSSAQKVLLLTVHEDSGLLREALKMGAAGYILKRAVESELLNAIRAVARGEIYIHPAMTRGLLAEESEDQQDRHSYQLGEKTLTLREREVLIKIAQGYTNRQIADLLVISIRTVESHRANLMAKLNLHSRVDLVRYATEHNMLKEA